LPRLALRGIETDFGPEHADTFRRDLRADYVLANPPFNDYDTRTTTSSAAASATTRATQTLHRPHLLSKTHACQPRPHLPRLRHVMLSYAIGAELSYADRRERNEDCALWHRLRIHAIARSVLFWET